jgi:hypothetical protein
MSSTQIIVLVVVIVVVLALVVAGWMMAKRAQLRRRFGPEYDHVVAEQGSRSAAERELRERERRHAQLSVRPLPEPARASYAAAWEQVQVRFIDAPAEAVGEADSLVTRVMSDRGYPTGDFDDQVAELSVEHGHTLGHYRDAHEIHLRNERGEATTEQLRQALVHYRALFADLLGLRPDEHPSAPAAGAEPIVDAGDQTTTGQRREQAATAGPATLAEPVESTDAPAGETAPEAARPARATHRDERINHA